MVRHSQAEEACQRRMERKVLGITLKDRISNARLQNITATVSIGQRQNGNGEDTWRGLWAQVTTMWDPYTRQTKRKMGRLFEAATRGALVQRRLT